ncbi:MAG: hydantoinase/oxoprolinase family protein, partial [Gammaproteobacteria bacterium]
MFSVDIDTGGTMTDTLVSGGPQPLLIKVESTPHDVTVSFLQSLEAAAAATGHDGLTAFLEHVDLIRWSSTITSNVLAQRTGPKLGLLVSAGHEDDLYAEDPAATAQVMPSLVRREHVAGLPADADRATIVALLKRLIDQGIRRVNVSLAGAFPDGSREQEILRIVGEQFPDHYLGSVPALAGSDMLMRPDDMSRTFYALINAYVHNSLANSLFKAEDLVKVEHQWKGDILVGHLNGGVARIGKTKAVDTIESGPLFGTHASAAIAAAGALPRVLAVDIGGTTAKASAVLAGRIEMRPEGHFFGIPVRTPMPVLRSIALGGGSVAKVVDGKVRLGPESMGAAPGPACYKLGGRNATLTDALVLLGLLSPSGFLDGRRVLDVDLAATALEKHVAQKLGVDVPG